MMLPAVTVPPYNSYDDYYVNVCANHYLHQEQSSVEVVYMEVSVLVRYLSSDKSIKRDFKGHHTSRNFKLPVHKLTSDDGKSSSLSSEIILLMILLMKIPFPLEDRLQWIEEHDGVYCPETSLMDEGDMIHHILDYARRKSTNTGCTTSFTPPQQPVLVVVTIEKSITLPHHEFEAWITWADNKKEVDGVNFDKEYSEVITGRPLRELEVQYLEIRNAAEKKFMPAATSSILALKELRFEGGGGGGGGELCPICMEEFFIGSEVTRMPCSHLYHDDCILRWLEKNNSCPNCRFKLVSRVDILLLLLDDIQF